MDGQPTWTDCVEAGDYVVPNVLSPKDLVSRPDNMDETVPHMVSTAVGYNICVFEAKHLLSTNTPTRVCYNRVGLPLY